MSFHLSLSIFLTIVCLLRESESQECLVRGSVETMSDLYSCDFEVFGIVQGEEVGVGLIVFLTTFLF